jgi:hypothetical protein
MFTLPLTVAEYHELVDVKYSPDAAAVTGWAFYDQHGHIRGWHRHEAGSRHWTHRDDAYAAFVPDSRKRRHYNRIGYSVAATHGIEELAALLRRARGEAGDTEHRDHESDPA